MDGEREVVIQMVFKFKDSRLLPLTDLIDYIGYRLNLGVGGSWLVQLDKVTVVKDTAIKE